ncbi:RDD family protein [Mycoplasma crocodyli]|uniref:RDD domain-containing protein n=1 Tax=Mycoplasma crocodyli (strain ATCC 51981 / MP145) TaxID=512564 RepID=D5E542_MYCCM|nr:RDD family protein [Mycoplasma crocodyli]ADE19845.1 hypothetical protein MCRO_0232 [Mycoplasma crocodyli MP145]
MLRYKNSSFWYRLLANMIDFIIVISLIIMFYVFTLYKKDFNQVAFIAFCILSSFLLMTYYVVMPILMFSSTIGQHICKIKMITNEKDEMLNRDILKRNIFGAFYWTLILIIMGSYFSAHPLKEIIKQAEKDRKWIDNLMIALVSTLSANWFTINFANYLFILFSKKRLALLDRFSNSRVVYKKQIYIEEIKNFILVPSKVQKRNIVFIKSNNNESENKG